MTKPETIGPGAWYVWQPDKGDELPVETASRAFKRKHGHPPERIVEQKETGYLFLGPEPEGRTT